MGKKRIRGLYIVKSRGTGHSSDVHKLILSDDGINLEPMEADTAPARDPKKSIGSGISGNQREKSKNEILIPV